MKKPTPLSTREAKREAKKYQDAYLNEVAENVRLRAKLRNVLEALGVDEFVAKEIRDHENMYHND